MDDAAPQRITWRDWAPAISCAALLLGAVLSAGTLMGQLRDNTRRIEQLERDGRDLTQKLGALDGRLARIEGKLDMLNLPREGRR